MTSLTKRVEREKTLILARSPTLEAVSVHPSRSGSHGPGLVEPYRPVVRGSGFGSCPCSTSANHYPPNCSNQEITHGLHR
eukprot:907321-Amphidinium_carterae.1